MSGYVPNLPKELVLEVEVRTRVEATRVELADSECWPSGYFYCLTCLCAFLPDFYNADVHRYVLPTAGPVDHDCLCHEAQLPSASNGVP